MLSLKGLKEQGRLGRSFGKVTIRDQPPSNTIQKIIAVKDAMRDVESYLQNINVTLLKIRTIILSGQPQVCCCDLCCITIICHNDVSELSQFFACRCFMSPTLKHALTTCTQLVSNIYLLSRRIRLQVTVPFIEHK